MLGGGVLKTLIVLPDGREISSGNVQENSIASAALTQQVNASNVLAPGSACASMIELKIITKSEDKLVSAGDEITVYSVDNSGVRQRIGLFTCENPTRSGAGILNITAYDRISWLDRDLTHWLAGLSAWPYSLYQFMKMTCEQCGLTFKNRQIPNGSYPVKRFWADGITGRNILQWGAQAAGRFCRAAPDGEIEFSWYEPADISIGFSQYACEVKTFHADGNVILHAPCVNHEYADGQLSILSDLIGGVLTDGDLSVTMQNSPERIPYYSGGFSHEDYSVDKIQKVQIQFSESDVGAIWPNTPGELNTYRVTGNYLLTAETADELLPVAKNLYEQLKDITYVPCKVLIPASDRVPVGSIVSITDADGKTYSAYVMKKTRTGGKEVIECTGSKSRSSTTVINNQSFKALSGKVLNLRTDVEGLKVENKDTTGKLASIALNIDGIRSQAAATDSNVSDLRSKMTEVTQTADGLNVTVQSIVQNGVSKVTTKTGYTFNEDGLKISKSGEEMENRLDNTGMYVGRSGEVLLQANNKGVEAADVAVRNYLIVGTHARFEDYAGGTGCFYIGGE